jgi:hypothetical protein
LPNSERVDRILLNEAGPASRAAEVRPIHSDESDIEASKASLSLVVDGVIIRLDSGFDVALLREASRR